MQGLSLPFTRDELHLEKKINERLNEGRLDVLVMPQVVVEVLGLLDSEGATIASIAAAVGRDQGVATHMLALANSAFYRGSVPVSSLEQAVIRLGLRELKGAVLMLSMRNVFSSKAHPALARTLWQHSLATALVARRITEVAGGAGDLAFLAGLVHDVGKVAVLALYERMVNGSEAARVSDDVLAQILDEFHIEAGRLLARDWELPPLAAEAVSNHHSDMRSGTHSREARVVALADKFARVMGFMSPGANGGIDRDAGMDDACRELGIDAAMQVSLIEETPEMLVQLEALAA